MNDMNWFNQTIDSQNISVFTTGINLLIYYIRSNILCKLIFSLWFVFVYLCRQINFICKTEKFNDL